MTTDEDDVEREVVEETVEETETLDQSNLSHEERREQEREALEGAGEVSLAEDGWTRQTEEDREAIRQAVDELEVDESTPSFDPVPPKPGVAVPGEAEVADPGLTLTGTRSEEIAPLSRSDRETVEEAYEGEVVQALALYEARRGRVVRVVVDRGEGLEEEKAVLADGEVRDLGSIVDDVDAIGADVDLSDVDEDALAPAEAEPAAEATEEAEPETVEEEAEDEEGIGARLGGLLDRGDEDEEAEDEADEAEPEEVEEPEPDAEAEPDEAAEVEDDKTDEEEAGLRDRVSGLLDRGGEEEADVAEPGDVEEAEPQPEEPETAEAEAAEAGDEDDGGLRDRVSGLLDRGGDEDETQAADAEEGEEADGDEGGLRDRVSGLLDRGEEDEEAEDEATDEASEAHEAGGGDASDDADPEARS